LLEAANTSRAKVILLTDSSKSLVVALTDLALCQLTPVKSSLSCPTHIYPKSETRVLTSEFSLFRAACLCMASRIVVSESLRVDSVEGPTSVSCIETEAFLNRAYSSLLSSFSILSSRAAT
jgi:hypothetical protein